MDLPRNAFKHAIAAGTPQLGAWLMSAAPSTAEALGCVGFDFLVVDMEHTPIDTPQMIDILRAIAGTSASAVTRLPWNDTVMVKRALDAGAQSLMFPFVQDEREAARAVAATRYPPAGIRGVSVAQRNNRFGTVADYFRDIDAQITVLVQIESLAGLEAAADIAAVDGVDGVFVGPSDLAAALGHLGKPGEASVQAAIAQVFAAAKSAGKPTGILTPVEADARRYLTMGATFVAVGSDLGVFRSATQQLRDRFARSG